MAEADSFASSVQSARRKPARGGQTRAISKCLRAYDRAYKKALTLLDEDQSDFEACRAGNEAYLRATPPLCGYENICDYIACISYASMTEVIRHKDAEHYINIARAALSAFFHQPRPVGRPPKPSATESSAGSAAKNK